MEGRTLLRWIAIAAGLVAVVSLARTRRGRAIGAGAVGALPFGRHRSREIEAEAAITIGRSAEDLYDAWLDTDLLTRVLSSVDRVEDLGEGRTRWVAPSPKGTISWESRHLAAERPRRIAWRTIEGSQVEQEGEVRFEPAPGDRGTEMRIRLRYRPPMGLLGAVGAALYGEEPGQALAKDLRRFKQLMETGEIATTEGQPAARASGSGSAGHLAKRIAEAARVAVRGGTHPARTELR